MILADPVGSVLAGLVNDGVPSPEGSFAVEGIGQNFVPDTADMTEIDKAYSIPDTEAIATARELLLKEGVLAGSSSGTLLAAALRYCREQTEPKRVVSFVCDTGAKYLSKVYNDAWLADQGLTEREMHGDLSDVITRKYEEGARGRHRPGRHPGHRLQAHARRRRVPAAGDRGRPSGGHPGRERHRPCDEHRRDHPRGPLQEKPWAR